MIWAHAFTFSLLHSCIHGEKNTSISTAVLCLYVQTCAYRKTGILPSIYWHAHILQNHCTSLWICAHKSSHPYTLFPVAAPAESVKAQKGWMFYEKKKTLVSTKLCTRPLRSQKNHVFAASNWSLQENSVLNVFVVSTKFDMEVSVKAVGTQNIQVAAQQSLHSPAMFLLFYDFNIFAWSHYSVYYSSLHWSAFHSLSHVRFLLISYVIWPMLALVVFS